MIIEKIDPYELKMLEYNGVIAMIGLATLIITIIYSAKNGGVGEVIENILLWFLLFMGITYISQYPITEDDEITGGIFFIAFGLCRIAKTIAKKAG